MGGAPRRRRRKDHPADEVDEGGGNAEEQRDDGGEPDEDRVDVEVFGEAAANAGDLFLARRSVESSAHGPSTGSQEIGSRNAAPTLALGMSMLHRRRYTPRGEEGRGAP